MAKPPIVLPRELQCQGKNVYRTKALTKRAISRTTSRRRRLIAYRCPHCGFFHIGGEGERTT